MNFNIFETMNLLAEGLKSYFAESPFEFKGTDSSIEYTKEIPHIYTWCVPMDDRNSSNYPTKIPSIALILDKIDPNGSLSKASITAHIAVANPSICDSEKVRFDVESGSWKFLDSKSYTQDRAYIDLYTNCLLLGTETITALQRLSKGSLVLDNVAFNPPDTELEDFPYAQCSVSFDVSYKVSTRSIPEGFRKFL